MPFEQAYDPFRALRSAWSLLGRAPRALLLGGALLVLTDTGGPHLTVAWQQDWIAPLGELDPAALPGLILASLLALAAVLCVWLLNTALHAGYAHAAERALQSEPDHLAALVELRGRFLKLVLTRALVWLVWLGVGVPLWAILMFLALVSHGLASWTIPGVAAFGLWMPVLIYVGLGLVLAPKATAVEGLDAPAALQRGWELARGRRKQLLVYYVLLHVVELLGLCLCGVGVLLTGAWTQAAKYESYLQLLRGEREPPSVERLNGTGRSRR